MKTIGIIALMAMFVVAMVAGSANAALYGQWRFNEGSGGTTQDVGATGTLHGATAWAMDSQRGSVLYFNGTGGTYVSGGTIPKIWCTKNFSWSFWTKQASGANLDSVIVGNRTGSGPPGGTRFIKATPRKFEYYEGSSDSYALDYPDVTGTWTHHVISKHFTGGYNSDFRYYRNGVWIEGAPGSGNTTIGVQSDWHPFYMGGDPGGEVWKGWLDDVRVYNDQWLTQTDVTNIYNSERSYTAPTANADGALAFDATHLSAQANGTLSSDPNGDIKSYVWTAPGGSFGGATPTVLLSQSGLTHPNSAATTLGLTVTDETLFTSSASTTMSYANTAVDVVSASGAAGIDDSIDFSAIVDDPDLAANAEVTGFEAVAWEFSYLGSTFLVGDGNIALGDDLTAGTLRYIFGDNGIYTVSADAQDYSGATDSLEFQFELVPEPATMLLLFGGGLFGMLRRRR